MKSALKRGPEIILRDGKPEAVIIKLKEYRKLLERLEDREDLEELEKIRKMPLRFKRLSDFIAEYRRSV